MALTDHVTMQHVPHFEHGRMIIGLSGWMDGGELSTGTVQTLLNKLGAKEFARINPGGFYIYNFPGTMDVSALFRPHIELADGLLKEYREPQNIFFADEENQLVLFMGQEPNIDWNGYGACLFGIAESVNVREIYFVGSVAGMVPHTREPRVSCVVSDELLKTKMLDYHIRFSDYSGPGSIVNLLLHIAQQRALDMVTMVAEIPPYIHGRNIRCIDAVVRRLVRMLDLDVDIEDLHELSDQLEKKVDHLIENESELAEHIKKLEENYDQDVFDTEMGDLKNWLQQRGIRLD